MRFKQKKNTKIKIKQVIKNKEVWEEIKKNYLLRFKIQTDSNHTYNFVIFRGLQKDS
jgi:hypothetical protein